jgi:hypothetical protein
VKSGTVRSEERHRAVVLEVDHAAEHVGQRRRQRRGPRRGARLRGVRIAHVLDGERLVRERRVKGADDLLPVARERLDARHPVGAVLLLHRERYPIAVGVDGLRIERHELGLVDGVGPVPVRVGVADRMPRDARHVLGQRLGGDAVAERDENFLAYGAAGRSHARGVERRARGRAHRERDDHPAIKQSVLHCNPAPTTKVR